MRERWGVGRGCAGWGWACGDSQQLAGSGSGAASAGKCAARAARGAPPRCGRRAAPTAGAQPIAFPPAPSSRPFDEPPSASGRPDLHGSVRSVRRGLVSLHTRTPSRPPRSERRWRTAQHIRLTHAPLSANTGELPLRASLRSVGARGRRGRPAGRIARTGGGGRIMATLEGAGGGALCSSSATAACDVQIWQTCRTAILPNCIA